MTINSEKWHDSSQIITSRQGDFLIRLAQDRDVTHISQLIHICYKPYIARMNQIPAPMKYDYHRVISEGKTWVIESGQDNRHNIVGLLTVDMITDALLIDNLAINPAQQGAGLAKRLIFLAEQYALAHGIHKITLYTNEKMTENIAIYQHLGFTITKKVQELSYKRIYFAKDLVPINPM